VAEEIFAVDVGSDVEGDEGSPLTFNGVMTDTGGFVPYLIEWDFGDGATAEGSLTAVHAYADNGVYTVTLTVTNSENQTVGDSLVVTVHNVAPTVTAVDDLTVIANNELAAVLATFTDPGWLDTHTAVIDWGDGTVTAGTVDQTAQTVSGSHTYHAQGVYTVTITVTDNDGGQGSDTLLVTVNPGFLYLPIILNNN
jgi:PKD repeat protein